MGYSIIGDALAELTNECFHYQAPNKTEPSYIVWSEDSSLDLEADNIHAEKAMQGTADLFTNDEDDELIEQIPEKFEEIGASYYKNSTQVEPETGLIHHEWVWSLCQR